MPIITNLDTLTDASAAKYINDNAEQFKGPKGNTGDTGPQGPAGGDISPEEVKTKYESNANTNAYTDTEKAKLSAIDQGLATIDDVVFNSVKIGDGTGDQGLLSWNADEETVDLVNNGAVLQIGQELYVHARNNTGSTIDEGTVVMATGTLGASGRITVAPYVAGTAVKYIIGVATETILDGDDGKITSFGKVRGIDTSSWSEGSILYPVDNGLLSSTKPASGTINPLAFVISSHANVGTIMVRVTAVDESKYDASGISYNSTTVEATLDFLINITEW